MSLSLFKLNAVQSLILLFTAILCISTAVIMEWGSDGLLFTLVLSYATLVWDNYQTSRGNPMWHRLRVWRYWEDPRRDEHEPL